MRSPSPPDLVAAAPTGGTIAPVMSPVQPDRPRLWLAIVGATAFNAAATD